MTPRQVLVEDGQPYVIDWSESETATGTHDFVYSAVFHNGWDRYTGPVDVPVLARLRDGLGEYLERFTPAVWMGVMLAEVGVKQYVDYNERRGTLRRWTHLADRYLAETESHRQSGVVETAEQGPPA